MVYGINAQATRGYPTLPAANWVVSQWSEGKGSYTQTVWRATKYVGCADAFNSSDRVRDMCSVSICLYAKVRVVVSC